MAPDDHGDAVDALFALAPAEFTAARNALVKGLKAEERRDEAAAIERLRRPTVVAWALNQVARTRPDDVARLVEAAAAVGEAQRALLDGGEAAALRSAAADRQQAAAVVARSARELAGTNHGDAVTSTLDAALADPGLVEALRTGRLTETLEAPAGFGFGLGDDAAPPAPRRRRRPGSGAGRTGRGGRRAEADADLATVEPSELDRAELERAELERAELERTAAEDAVAAADEVVAHAARRLAEATAAVGEAERELAARRAAEQAAQTAHDDAEGARDQARRRREIAAEAVTALAPDRSDRRFRSRRRS